MQAISAWWWEAAGFIEFTWCIPWGNRSWDWSGWHHWRWQSRQEHCFCTVFWVWGFDKIMFASQMLPICRKCGNKAPLVFLWVAHGLPCLDYNFQDAVGPWERCRSHTLPMCCIFRVLCVRTHGTGTGARLEGTSTKKFCQAARNVCEIVWVCIALVLCFYRTYMA